MLKLSSNIQNIKMFGVSPNTLPLVISLGICCYWVLFITTCHSKQWLVGLMVLSDGMVHFLKIENFVNPAFVFYSLLILYIWRHKSCSLFNTLAWSATSKHTHPYNIIDAPVYWSRNMTSSALSSINSGRFRGEHQNPPRASRALKLVLDPSCKGLPDSRSWSAYMHIFICSPLNENPGSAPDKWQI